MRLYLKGAVLAFAVAACDAHDPAEQTGTLSGDPMHGQFAFAAQCATCHASGDGIDLAAFRFTDTTIIRRAVRHVDSLTARDIVAHIRTLHAQELDRDTRIFQPGQALLANDVAFAVGVFGADAWPADMTTDRLRAIDPRAVSVAIELPVWSDEGTNLDWMPDVPLPAGILDDKAGLARAAIAIYRATPTKDNLVRAVAALRAADHRSANNSAPCLLDDSLRVNFVQCFEVRRWTSTLVAQHLIRFGLSDQIDLKLHDVWWDVGNAARRSLQAGVSDIDNARENWAAWMYLSWTFAPSEHASVYNGGGLYNIGLPRHATFVALRSQVARAPGTELAYRDVQSAANFAPPAWAYEVTSFGLRHLMERLNAGDLPAPMSRVAARDAVAIALANAQRKVNAAQRAQLAALAAQVLALLPY